MQRSRWPLAHNRSFRPGLGWDWWTVEFEAADQPCRLLVTLNAPKAAYRAWLATQHADGLALLARLEFEPRHPDEWHCHVCCADSHQVPLGVVKHPRSVRAARLRMWRHRRGFEITQGNALEVALRFFAIAEQPPGGLFDA